MEHLHFFADSQPRIHNTPRQNRFGIIYHTRFAIDYCRVIQSQKLLVCYR
jgi:hypothetical protein